jgi:uncharacterized repeat protein (TIGR01451 family)
MSFNPYQHARTLLRNGLVVSALAGLATGLAPAAPASADPPLADLVVDLTVDRTEVLDSGEWANLAVDLRNAGTRVSQDITLDFLLPPGASLATDGYLFPPGWQCDTLRATCTHTPLEAGAAAGLLETPFWVPSGTAGDVITLGVAVSTGPESSTANNTDAVDLRYIRTTVDLEVTTSSPDQQQVVVGEVVALEATVRNAGTGPSGYVVVRVPLPAGMTRQSESGDGWDCLLGRDSSGSYWRCTHGPLRGGETAPMRVAATVTSANPGDVFTLAATASTTSTETTLDNNTAQTTASVLQPATVRGTVWLDADRDGLRDAGEDGVSGESIDHILIDPQTEGQPDILATVNLDGTYVAQVRPGTHRVEFRIWPHDFTAATDSDVVSFDNSTGYGYSGWFTLAAGEEAVIDAAVI